MKQYRGIFLFLPKNTFPALKKNWQCTLSQHCTRPRSALGTGSTRNLKKSYRADFEKMAVKVSSNREIEAKSTFPARGPWKNRGVFLFLSKNTFPALKKNSPFNFCRHCTRPRSALGTGSTRNLKKSCVADSEKTSMKVLSERGEVGGFRRSENSEKIGNAPGSNPETGKKKKIGWGGSGGGTPPGIRLLSIIAKK